MLPPYLRAHPDGVYLQLKLQPRATENAIGDALGSELKIKVTAPPVDAAANEALLRFLADQLGCPRGAVQLVRGHTSRHKLVFVLGLTADEVSARLRT
jgi:uncharacterized protein (TIGR00251 family)